MQREINLIPDNLVKKKEKSVLVGISFKVLVVLLFVAFVVFVVSFYLQYKLNNSLKDLNATLTQKKESVRALEKIEQKNSELSQKLSIAGGLLKLQDHYSIFLEEITKVTPTTVVIDDLNFTTSGTVVVSGSANSYGSLGDFIGNISKATTIKDSIFMEVSLSEVSLKKETGKIGFSSILKSKENALKVKESTNGN